MFIEYLNREEKEVFFSLALELVKVDDDFSAEEKEKIRTLSLRILGEEGYDTEHLNSDLSLLDNLTKKKIVLTELIGLSYIDGEYCDSERAYIRNLAEKLEVEETILVELEEWSLGLINHIGKVIEMFNK